MKEIIPGDGAPNLIEPLSFSEQDSAIAVGAVSYYLSSSLRTLEANWDGEGFDGVLSDVASANDNIDDKLGFAQLCKTLANKFTEHHENPTVPVDLTKDELRMLGRSLFRYGNAGYMHANKAIETGSVGFSHGGGEGQRERTIEALAERRERSFTIFKQLEPIANNAGMGWFV